ncbi:hypothetical protein HDV00_006550 [Rhizophlyctis rosea]|nr:hypothetical protein HDV00_006550 [Rhizophlyctis rosea]
MDESLAAVNALKWALNNVLNDGDMCVVLSVVATKEEEYPRQERMKSLLAVTREPYSKAIKLSLRVMSGDVPTTIIEQVTKHHPQSLIIGTLLHSSLIGMKTYIEPQYAQTHSQLVSYLLENVPPSIPVISVRYIPPEEVEQGADRRKRADSIWDL